MTQLTTLNNKSSYIPGLWDLCLDSQARNYWIENFKESTQFTSSLIENKNISYNFKIGMNNIISNIYEKKYITVHNITVDRELLLDRIGCPDPFYIIKKKESEKALTLLEDTISFLGNLNPKNKISFSISAILEGNLFDLGSPLTSKMWKNNTLKFNFKNNKNIPEKILSYLLLKKNGEGVVLVDNAGYDFVIGSVSFITVLLQLNWKIVVAANSKPSLNDITLSEIKKLNNSICKSNTIWARAYKLGNLKFISSGVFTPGINLLKISNDLNDSINSCSLIIFIGQGRAIETTLNANIDKDVLRIAKIKDKLVAKKLNLGQLSDFLNLTIND